MFERLIEWFRGEINPEYRGCFVPNTKLDNTNPPTRCGEKETPETNPSEPLPKESDYERERRIHKEKLEKFNKEFEQAQLIKEELLKNEKIELQKIVDGLILNEPEFEIGQYVEYIKTPNNNVEFYVKSYNHSKVVEDYCRGWYVYISKSELVVQYFDANQILQTIKDEIKWFKKV